MKTSKIDFEVNKGYVAAKIPQEAYPTESITYSNEKAWMDILEQRLKDYTNGEMTVVGVGAGVEWVKVGDTVLTANFCRLETIYRNIEGFTYPRAFWIFRESEILLKSA